MQQAAAQPREMISYAGARGRFNLRVGAVMLDRDRVLLQRAESDDFWCVPGGRVELLESAAMALARELREEIGVAAEVGRLLWVAENFFTYLGCDCHELGFYFLVSCPEHPELFAQEGSFFGHEPDLGIRLIYRWFPLDELPAIRVLPDFLPAGLRNLPAATAHLVHHDV